MKTLPRIAVAALAAAISSCAATGITASIPGVAPAAVATAVPALVPGLTAQLSATQLTLAAEATSRAAAGDNFAFGFPLPAPVDLTGISGTLSLRRPAAGFAEVLVSLFDLPTEACPANGATTWTSAGYPDLITLGNWIVKASGAASSITVDVPLSAMPFPLSGCVVLVLGDGAASSATANLALAIEAGDSGGPFLIGVGGEVCFSVHGGMAARKGAGCESLESAAVATVPGAEYVSVTHVASALAAAALYGSVSYGAFDGKPLLNAPAGPWSGTVDVYLLPSGCPRLPKMDGFYGPGKYSAKLPPDAQSLAHVALAATGAAVAQQPVFRGLDLAIAPGACVAHIMALDTAGAPGGVDAEVQLGLEVAPAPAETTAAQ
ncbi:MAG TPA: hypothetical protein VNE67_09125 [Acetobacteraceae bacterium]|nr:hypothetical protein [Acetobacteraceae bacterium]